MNKKENELIFERYVKPRNTNKRQSITIVEAIDHVMSLPRVKRHGKTLVSEADLIDVLRKLKVAGLGKVKKNEPMVDPKTGERRIATDDDVANDVERTKGHARALQGEFPIDPDIEEQPADDQAKLDVEVVEKLRDAADENGQIDLLDVLRIIAGE